jgi:chromosome segregation ATPase
VTQKSDLESQIKDVESRFHDEEATGQELNKKKKKREQEIDGMKKDIDDIRLSLQKFENECKPRDNQIHMLQDEMAQQDESIAKLTRERRRLEEQNTKTTEQLEAEEDKVYHLNKLKTKVWSPNSNRLSMNSKRISNARRRAAPIWTNPNAKIKKSSRSTGNWRLH